MNPLASVIEWCDKVGHKGKTDLYAGLVYEEAEELAWQIKSMHNLPDTEAEVAAVAMKSLSDGLKIGDMAPLRNEEALDAALDIAWVSLCLAYQLIGDADKLRQAWDELHRSNITDKQVDGEFVRDANGKIKKPAGWRAPDFARFL